MIANKEPVDEVSVKCIFSFCLFSFPLSAYKEYVSASSRPMFSGISAEIVSVGDVGLMTCVGIKCGCGVSSCSCLNLTFLSS